MNFEHTIRINFRGGIISPGDLYKILGAAAGVGIMEVRFGLRQQLLITASTEECTVLIKELEHLQINHEMDSEEFPNIVSSYPAEEIFITHTWLSEGVYKDIFDGIDYKPRLKINVSDSNQGFTPIFTGNINWVASPESLHFWHLFIRFPRTNTIYEWNQLVYTNDVARISKDIEALILEHKDEFVDNKRANGEILMAKIQLENYITKDAVRRAVLPPFNLPYYEGLNRYDNKYWLGVYRRDELFSVSFLKELCLLCLETKIGQLCCTPWKSIIVKGIEEPDRLKWNRLLDKHQVNMRHAANELNFQVEDNCREGLALKNYLVKELNDEDTRTFGVCIGIKTRRKSEVFSSILVRKKPVLSIFGIGLIHLYDILCAKDFNPNERTGFVFSRNKPKYLLGEQLRLCITAYYNSKAIKLKNEPRVLPKKEPARKPLQVAYIHQCRHCLTVYDALTGDPENEILPGTPFETLPGDYTCPLCEAGKTDFTRIDKASLGLQPV